jgi:hypothetical protein
VFEDAMRREQSQDPIEPVRVGIAGGRELADRNELVPDVIGNPQLSDEMNAPRCDTSGGQRPDDLVRLPFRHGSS